MFVKFFRVLHFIRVRVCFRMCVCVCEREREIETGRQAAGEREGEGGRERGRERETLFRATKSLTNRLMGVVLLLRD